MKRDNRDQGQPANAASPSGNTPAQADNSTRYMQGVFTPLDQVQVCAALRKLWQMFADRNTSEAVAMQALELYRSAIDRCGVDQFCAMVRASDELAAMKQLMVSCPDIYTNIKALRP